MNCASHPFRVFISYAHEDSYFVHQVAELLKAQGLMPVWDREIRTGLEFTDEIKRLIATAHVFMPLITPRSKEKPWVHQEIGFANGIGLPVVAIAVDTLPQGMTAGVQAICLNGDFSALPQRLKEVLFTELVLGVSSKPELQRPKISDHLADYPGKRTQLLIEHADEILGAGTVRQRAIFSSFSLPRGGANDPAWQPMLHDALNNEEYRDLLSRERRLLERHAQEAGCALILNPFVDFKPVGAKVHRAQLSLLVDFLKSLPAEKVTAAIAEAGIAGNVTIIGDWMVATAVPPQPGAEYRGTFFTRHACTVMRYLNEFDEELQSHLAYLRVQPCESRDYVLARLETRLQNLPIE